MAKVLVQKEAEYEQVIVDVPKQVMEVLRLSELLASVHPKNGWNSS
jgi:hypothetical protein